MMKTVIMASAMSLLISGATWANDVKHVTPWPPVTTDRHNAENWPVPHPAPAVDLNTVPAGIVFRDMSTEQRIGVQAALSRVNMYAGVIDGSWNAETFVGTRAYAERVGLLHTLNSTHGSLRIFRHIAN